jgi:hypothetical protein
MPIVGGHISRKQETRLTDEQRKSRVESCGVKRRVPVEEAATPRRNPRKLKNLWKIGDE